MKALREMLEKWEEEARQELLNPTDGSIQMCEEELNKTKFDPTDGGADQQTEDQMVAVKVDLLRKKYGNDRDTLYHIIRNENPDLNDLKIYKIMEKYTESYGNDLRAIVAFVYETMKKGT
jgi:hypothetical protein